MKLTDFRARVLAALQAGKAQRPGAGIHLVYAPELADPLELVKDTRRDSAKLTGRSTGVQWPDEAWPRIVTLDCMRVAAYLLEQDAGLDDPLMEASITQAHAEVWLGAGVQSIVTNDAPEHAENAVCGWIISPEDAVTIARRINGWSAPVREPIEQPKPGQRFRSDRRWLRWYQPDHFAALWPTLTDEQQGALLGPALWLAHTPTRELRAYAAGEQVTATEPAWSRSGSLKVVQWKKLDNVPLVTQLTQQWSGMLEAEGARLPDDVSEQLHRHVAAGQAQGLGGENLLLYVLVAVQLVPGATDAPEFMQMIRFAVDRDASLREGLRTLPDAFWERHTLEQLQAVPAGA